RWRITSKWKKRRISCAARPTRGGCCPPSAACKRERAARGKLTWNHEAGFRGAGVGGLSALAADGQENHAAHPRIDQGHDAQSFFRHRQAGAVAFRPGGILVTPQHRRTPDGLK